MKFQFDGQCVVVLGAARGIGLAIARAFVDAGASVVGFDRSAPSDSTDLSIGWVIGDVMQREDVVSLRKKLGHVDHIVYCVGTGSGVPGFPFWDQPVSIWESVLNVNLIGAVTVATEFAPSMAEAKTGSFLFLASVAGQIGSPTDPPYSAAKAGLINFMQVAARDLAPYGVRANAISPGMIKTDLNRSVWMANQSKLTESERQSYEEWGDEKVRRIAPLGRWQTPEDCAAVAIFLASSQAANITGQTINVDGGQVMHS